MPRRQFCVAERLLYRAHLYRFNVYLWVQGTELLLFFLVRIVPTFLYSPTNPPVCIFSIIIVQKIKLLVNFVMLCILCFLMDRKSVIVSFEYWIGDTIFSYRIRNATPILTAEFSQFSIGISQSCPPPPTLCSFFIASYSLAVLSSNSKTHSSHPFVTRIYILISILSNFSIKFTFIWAPGHKVSPGNVKIDSVI